MPYHRADRPIPALGRAERPHRPRPAPPHRGHAPGVAPPRPARTRRRSSRPAATWPSRSSPPPRATIPSIVWEGNVVPGRATRAIGRWATRVAVAFPPTAEAFGERASCRARPSAPSPGSSGRLPGTRCGWGTTSGCSSSSAGRRRWPGSRSPSRSRCPRWSRIGSSSTWPARRAWPQPRRRASELPAGCRDRYRPEPFLTDRMASALVAADVVLGRAGSSTCAEVAAVGVAAILVPYPYAHGHQAANAAWLADHGAAVAVPDAELTGERLRTELAALRADGPRLAMAAAAKRPRPSRRRSGRGHRPPRAGGGP